MKFACRVLKPFQDGKADAITAMNDGSSAAYVSEVTVEYGGDGPPATHPPTLTLTFGATVTAGQSLTVTRTGMGAFGCKVIKWR